MVSYHLVRSTGWGTFEYIILVSAHLIWISLLLLATSMMVMFSGLKKAGIPVGNEHEPPSYIPEGVIAVAGYTNRFLIICYIGWLILKAYVYLSL